MKLFLKSAAVNPDGIRADFLFSKSGKLTDQREFCYELKRPLPEAIEDAAQLLCVALEADALETFFGLGMESDSAKATP